MVKLTIQIYVRGLLALSGSDFCAQYPLKMHYYIKKNLLLVIDNNKMSDFMII